MSESVDATLKARGAIYGDFAGHAEVTQKIKTAMYSVGCEKWNSLTPSQREALEMIAHKIGRILNGFPAYADNWHDIGGYARLVEQQSLSVVPTETSLKDKRIHKKRPR